jgi:hypothetical protein
MREVLAFGLAVCIVVAVVVTVRANGPGASCPKADIIPQLAS